MDKQDFFKIIKRNIQDFSYHVTVVKGKEHPRYAYTIGNFETQNCEFVIAGNSNFQYEDLLLIFNEVCNKTLQNLDKNLIIKTEKFGSFHLEKIDSSWSKKMLLGVYDYYNINDFTAYQIVPDASHYTLDIPDMTKEWHSENQPMWKWLDDTIVWNLNVPRDSTVITDVNSLFGKKITEVMRWDENEWEAFTQNGEDIPKKDIRIVPISIILGIDDSLEPILKLDIEKGFWRDEEIMEWNNWG